MNVIRSWLSTALPLLGYATLATAATWHVPADHPTIQEAINAATTGDSVVVADGTYTGPLNRDLDFGGKNLVLASVNGPEFTTIDCEELGRGLILQSGEDSTSVVEGFHIYRGRSAPGHYTEIPPGGGIYAVFATPVIRNCVIDSCVAGGGGGVWTRGGRIEDCLFRSNQGGGKEPGGALFAYSGTAQVMVENCEFVDNYSRGTGGGVGTSGPNGVTISNGSFSGNVSRNKGGGIWVSGPTTIVHTTITGDSADAGGAIGITNYPVSIIDCTLQHNRAASSGGALVLQTAAVVDMIGCDIAGNRAVVDGGAIYGISTSSNYTLTLDDCDVLDNVAGQRGGALYTPQEVTLGNCRFKGNSANQGGGLFFGVQPLLIEDCVIAGNFATDVGGGIYAVIETIGLTSYWRRCSIVANAAGAEAGGIYLETVVSPTVRMEHSILWGNCPEGANGEMAGGMGEVRFLCSDLDQYDIGGLLVIMDQSIDIDPQFCDRPPCEDAPTSQGDFTLVPGSPCRAEAVINPCGELMGPLDQGCTRQFEPVGLPGGAYSLPGVIRGDARFGDADGDHDFEILLTGLGDPDNVTGLYRVFANGEDQVFLDVGAGFPALEKSSVAWGDHDNDGDLDVLISGDSDGGTPITAIYENDAGTYVDVGADLVGFESPAMAWGDYDNDGDADLVLTGNDESSVGISPNSVLYRNEGGVEFVDVGAGLPGVWRSSVDWGDYDGDGDLDLAIAGEDAGSSKIAAIYRNDDQVFTDTGAALPGVTFATVEWGDYDSDGDPDLLIAGSGDSENVLAIHRNDGGLFTDVSAGLMGLGASSAAWGDCDGDGDLDIILAGLGPGPEWGSATVVYRNDGDDVFTGLDLGILGVGYSSVQWGDSDNDGDLDVLITGLNGGTYLSLLYRNNSAVANAPPSAPTGLSAEVVGGVATFTWGTATDSETPTAGLTYNLRVGTTPGGSEVMSALADPSDGHRYVPAFGNVGHRLSWSLTVDTEDLYWSVQAIDAGFAGSPFAPEATVGMLAVEDVPLPSVHALRAGRPNPFRTRTTISFDLPEAAVTRLTLYDVGGRHVCTIADGEYSAGRHRATVTSRTGGSRLYPGVYFLRMEAGEFRADRRLVVLE